MSKSYENLNIWKDAILFAKKIYKITEKFPKHEIYGLVSQLRRASVSISANVAEGSSRSSKKDNARFIEIAIGSLYEIKSLLTVAKELRYLDEKSLIDFYKDIDRLGNSLGGFKKYLKK